MPDTESTTTPIELARQLGHTDNGRAIRAWLRLHHPRPEIEKHQPWSLTSAVADGVLAAFQR